MKRISALIGAVALTFSSMAWAACSTHTFTSASGRMVICTTCCYGGNCNTNCY